MSDVAVSSPVTEAYLSALEEVAPNRVGDGVRGHAGKPPASYFPYVVLYVGTTLMQGTFVNPNEDGLHRVQVTSVGRTRESCEAMRDLVRPVLLDDSLYIDGYYVVYAEMVNSQPISRDDDVDPPVFFAVDVANVLVTPASGS